MKVSLVFTTLVFFTAAASNVLNPWRYLPRPSDWSPILRSFEDADQVKSYVHKYVRPFKQLQSSVRDADVHPETIKTSVLAMLDSILQSCRAFIVTELDFERKSKEVYKKLLDDATAHFDSPGVNLLQPVFKTRAIKYFVFQRFDDLLVASRRHRDFLEALKQFKSQVKSARHALGDMDPPSFKFIIPRNLDLDLVSDYSGEVIALKIGRTLDAEDMEKLRYQLHSLGNNANVGIVSSYAMLLVVLAITINLF